MDKKAPQPWPKTALCCGLKPKRMFYQTGFRDDEGYFTLTCKKCKRKVSLENNHRGESKVELEAILLWNNHLLMK